MNMGPQTDDLGYTKNNSLCLRSSQLPDPFSSCFWKTASVSTLEAEETILARFLRSAAEHNLLVDKDG